MASIAYITDRKMIEFHRLNGHQKMNFWRPTSSKKFADFNIGDMLFFLAKGTERGITREKGIVGYGKFTKSQTLTFSKMWNLYGAENGYATKEELSDAIMKVSKTGSIPAKMNCIYLENVVFFQSPVYLSEIGLKLSKKMESYIYLDNQDPMATYKVLNLAKISGIDMWSMALQDEFEQDVFVKEELRHQLSGVAEKLAIDRFSENQKKRIAAIERKMLDAQTIESPIEKIRGHQDEMVSIYPDLLIYYVPFACTSKDYEKKKQELIGHVWSINEELKKVNEINRPIVYKIISDQKDEELEAIISGFNTKE